MISIKKSISFIILLLIEGMAFAGGKINPVTGRYDLVGTFTSSGGGSTTLPLPPASTTYIENTYGHAVEQANSLAWPLYLKVGDTGTGRTSIDFGDSTAQIVSGDGLKSITVNNTNVGVSGQMQLSGYDCSGNTNTGKLTVNALNNLVCSDDISGAGGSGGYSVEPATVTIIANKGLKTSTLTITGLGVGVLHSVTTSSNVTSGLVYLATETSGSYVSSLTVTSAFIITGTNNVNNAVPIVAINFSSVASVENTISISSANANLMSKSSGLLPNSTSYIWNSVSIQTATIDVSSGTIAIFNSTVGVFGNVPYTPLPDNPLTVIGRSGNFVQFNIMNTSADVNASGDLVITSNLGTNTSGYVNLGINSSSYTQTTFDIIRSSDSYLYAQNRSLAIGTADPASDSWLRFFTGGTTGDKQRVYITNIGTVAVVSRNFAIGGTTITWPSGGGTSGQAIITDGNNPPTWSYSTITGGSAVIVSSGPTYASTNTTTVTNSTTETSFRGSGYGSSTFTANSMYVGETFFVQASGYLSDAAAAQGTLQIKLKIGGSTVAVTAAFTPTGNQTNSIWDLKCLITVRSIGANGSVISNNSFIITDSLGITQDVYPMLNTAVVPIDTTKAINDVDATVTWGTASGSNIFTCTNFIVDNFNGNAGSTATAGGSVTVSNAGNYRVAVSSAGSLTAVAGFNVHLSSIVIASDYAVFMSSLTISSITITNAGSFALNNASFTFNPATGAVQIGAAGDKYNIWPSTGYAFEVDLTTNVATLVNMIGAQWMCAPSEIWAFDANLAMTGVTGGTEFGINGPTGSTATMVTWGNTSAVGTFSMNTVTALNTASTVALASSNTTPELVTLRGTMRCSLTAGAVNLMWKSVTAANVSTIKAGSNIYVHRQTK